MSFYTTGSPRQWTSCHPFLNILDRGFGEKMAAWKRGRQVALQPPQLKCDGRFRGCQIVYTQRPLPKTEVAMSEESMRARGLDYFRKGLKHR